ncbi:MAG: ester cyclase [Ktedonobacterales bacterium]
MFEQNKATFRAIPEKLVNTGNLDTADQYFAPDFVDHTAPAGLPNGLAGFKAYVTMWRGAFPDLHLTVEDVVAEGETVVVRATARGTMRGDFQGMKATGKTATWTEIHIGRLAAGKVSEHWAAIDQLGALQQLGLVATPEQQVIAPAGIKN